jgi:predicted transcriptional regulator
MEFHLTAVQEAALREVAAQNGAKVEDLVRDAVDQMLSHDAWFKNQVQVGLDQIERGDVVTHEGVGARIDRIFGA